MGGKGGDFVRRVAAQSVRSIIDQYNTLTTDSSGGEWFIGKVSADKTKIQDPAGITYKLKFTGQVQQYTLARRLTPTLALAIGTAPLNQLNVEGGIKAYLIEYDSIADKYYVKNLISDTLYFLDAYTISGVVTGVGTINTIRFFPDGKNILVGGGVQDSNGDFVAQWGILKAFSLGNDDSNNPVVKGTILAGTKTITYTDLGFGTPSDPGDPALAFFSHLTGNSTSGPSYTFDQFWSRDTDKEDILTAVLGGLTVNTHSISAMDYVPQIDSNGELKVQLLGSWNSTFERRACIKIDQEVIAGAPLFETDNASYGAFSLVGGFYERTITVSSVTSGGSATTPHTENLGTIGPDYPTDGFSNGTFGPGVYNFYGNGFLSGGGVGNFFYSPTTLLNQNKIKGIFAVSDIASSSVTVAVQTQSRIVGPVANNHIVISTVVGGLIPASGDRISYSYVVNGTPDEAHTPVFTRTDGPGLMPIGFKNKAGLEVALTTDSTPEYFEMEPFTNQNRTLTSLPVALSGAHDYYTSDLSSFNDASGLKALDSESFVAIIFPNGPSAPEVTLQNYSTSPTIKGGPSLKGKKNTSLTLIDWIIRK